MKGAHWSGHAFMLGVIVLLLGKREAGEQEEEASASERKSALVHGDSSRERESGGDRLSWERRAAPREGIDVAGLKGELGRGEWLLVQSGDQITDAAVDKLELSEDQRVEAQGCLLEFLEEQKKALAKRAVYKEELSDAESEVFVYDVPPAGERGEIWKALRMQVAEIAGEEKAEVFMEGLAPPWHGQFCNLAVRVRFYPNRCP